MGGGLNENNAKSASNESWVEDWAELGNEAFLYFYIVTLSQISYYLSHLLTDLSLLFLSVFRATNKHLWNSLYKIHKKQGKNSLKILVAWLVTTRWIKRWLTTLLFSWNYQLPMNLRYKWFTLYTNYPNSIPRQILGKDIQQTFLWRFLKSVTTLCGWVLPSFVGGHPFLGCNWL